MSTLPLLNHTALDDNGDPLPGAKLYFYETGTTTPLDTYSDESLSVANTNPVVADADGRFDRIFLKTDQAYTVAFKTTADAQIWSEDNVRATNLASSSFQTRLKQVASNPLDYGAIGDGAADEYLAVQSAVDNATGVVDLLGKTYRCDTQITVTAGITLKNGTLDFTNCTDNDYLFAEGSGLQGAKALTSDATAADESIDVANVSGLAVGDLIILESAQVYVGSIGDGEMCRIAAISGTTLTLASPIYDTYTVANSGQIRQIVTDSRITLQSLTLLCSEGASGNGNAIRFKYVDGVLIDDVKISNPKGTGIKTEYCHGIVCRNMSVYGLTNIADAVHFTEASADCICTGLVASNVDVGVKIGDTNTVPQDGRTWGCAAADCVIIGCNKGAWLTQASSHCSIQNGLVRTLSGGASYDVDAEVAAVQAWQTTIQGAYFERAGTGTTASATGIGYANGAGVRGIGGANSEGVVGYTGAGASFAGVYGWGSSGDTPGVKGDGNGAGEGGLFTGGATGNGVEGYATGSNKYGVYGNCDNGGAGVRGDGDGSTSDGYGVEAVCNASPGAAPFRISPSAQPTSGVVGDIYVNTSGVLYVCTATGTPGTWTVVGTQT